MNLSAFVSDLVGKRVEVRRRQSDEHNTWSTDRGVLRGVGADGGGIVLIIELEPDSYHDPWPVQSIVSGAPVVDGREAGRVLPGGLAIYRWDWNLRVRDVSGLPPQ